MVKLHARAIGSTLQLERPKFRAPGTAPWSFVEAGLRGKLAEAGVSSPRIYTYVAGFAPLPEQRLDDLSACFATGGELVVQYSLTPAFG